MSYNKTILIGNLCSDVEVKLTNSDVPYTTFSVAVGRNYSKGAEKVTDFIKVTAWRRTAEFISEYFSKGSEILIEGSINTNNYTNKEGKTVYSTYVCADKVSFVGGKSKGQSGGHSASGYEVEETTESVDYDDPF